MKKTFSWFNQMFYWIHQVTFFHFFWQLFTIPINNFSDGINNISDAIQSIRSLMPYSLVLGISNLVKLIKKFTWINQIVFWPYQKSHSDEVKRSNFPRPKRGRISHCFPLVISFFSVLCTLFDGPIAEEAQWPAAAAVVSRVGPKIDDGSLARWFEARSTRRWAVNWHAKQHTGGLYSSCRKKCWNSEWKRDSRNRVWNHY